MSSRSKKPHPVLYFTLILALASQACSLSLLDLPFLPTAPTQVPAGNPPTPMARAEVKFTVQVPEPLAAGEILAISIVDEVTGLALNFNDYQLTMVDSITYSAAFPIPDQSVIKYRYVRRNGATRVLEDSNTDASIRYRLVYVNGNVQITDTISSWTDKPVNAISGSISGVVRNIDTNAPLAEIMVTAGGVQTLTDSAGRFTLNGLRGGAHNIVAYALDGTYQTFQQGANVEGNKGTPVEIKMKAAPMVNVVFNVSVPTNTQQNAPLRMAGNLIQFGNTFADLRGGLSVVADRIPVLTPQADGRYSVSLFLPVGAYLEYKYTMGDGFWNSEFNTAGRYVTRSIVIPAQDIVVNDSVQSWQTGPNAPILFEVDVPQSTPIGDKIYIQFNSSFGWTEPLPMWKVSDYQWAYKLFGPLNILGALTYRYCRNAQCNSADDESTAGENAHGKNVTPSIAAQDIKDKVEKWTWSNPQNATLVQTNIPARGDGFIAGIEFQQYHDPALHLFANDALKNIQALGSNWAVLDPSWTYSNHNPLIFSQQPGKDPFNIDTTGIVASARALNLNVALFPQPRFAKDANDFWKNAPRDSTWWDNWFNHYRAFAVHFADMATRADAQAVILGGDWIAPALPNGRLADGASSGVPADAETRWLNIVAEVRQHYTGRVFFALPYTNADILAPINVLKSTDGMYLLWFAKLSPDASPNKSKMITEAGNLLDSNIFPIYSSVNKPVIIGLSYPSSNYSATGCIPGASGGCLDWTSLNRPNADISTVSVDLQQQFDIYDAMLNAINGRTWVNGVVSRGYFAPVALQDKSASVHSKPAADLLWYWFPRLLGNVK